MKYYPFIKDELSKVKTDNLILRQNIANLEKRVNYLEKENKILINSDKNDNYFKHLILSLISKNFKYDEQSRLLENILNEDKIPLMNLLLNRIEALEIQNYHLITKNETLAQMITGYIDELVEYYEVVFDIKNVLNQVYDAQTLTREFIIIRETLNSKNEYLKKQKEIYLEEKNHIMNDSVKQMNNDVLLCKHKIEDFKLEKLSTILDDKINYYDIVKGYVNSHGLVHDNHLLRMNNLRLRNLMLQLLKEDVRLNENIVMQIDSVLNNFFDVILAEDLFYMLNSQAQLIENIINN